MEVGLYFLFKKTPILSAEVRFSFHRGQMRELFTRYCQYPVTLLEFLKVYVLSKKISCTKKEMIVFTSAFISIPYLRR